MAAALEELGAALRGAPEGLPFLLDEQTLRNEDRFTFDTRLGPLDILGDPDGSDGYDALRANADRFEIAGVEVWTCSLDDLIAMKRASGRVKDRIHVEEFAALREEREALEARGIDPDAPPPA
ncbi:MAG: hypothetical protein KY469_06085 [Actinobacteria bacterium]|nr:hypothetical protein [Actinomycetota bacterium]